MRVVHYSQHVLGVGHFFRSLEIAKALAPNRVEFITGGEEVDVPLPDHVTHIPLPVLRMDRDFKNLLPGREGDSVEDILEERRTRLMDLMYEVRPDVFLVELYPFGRKKFGFELDPVLEGIRAGEFGKCKAVCSLRDILVEKKEQDKFEKRVLEKLNGSFDLLLVHSDPSLVRLDETFSRMEEIAPEVAYTGYVTPFPDPMESKVLRHQLIREARLGDGFRLVTAAAGGGAVGDELLEAVIRASALLHVRVEHLLQVWTGPFMDAARVAELEHLADPHAHIRVERFTDAYPARLGASDLSVSMAGYNTTMNLLASGTYGLVMPFGQNREQAMRAERLEERGVLRVLRPADLDPLNMARRMETALERMPSPHGVNLDGARTTARLLEECIEQ